MGRFERTFKIMFLVPLVLLMLTPAIMPVDSFSISQGEIDAVTDMIGPEHHAATIHRAQGWYKSIFTNSETDAKLSNGRSKNVLGFESATSSKSAEYMNKLKRLVYRALYRVSVEAHMLIGALAIFVAAMVDGFMQRNIRSQEFRYNNPVVFRLVSGVFLLTITSFTILPLWPGQLYQYIWLIAIVLIALSIWASSRHFQTGS